MNELETNAVMVHGLSRSFRGKTALSEIDLKIPQGCVFGLVGLNGAGKTTLIRHLIGSLKAQSGSVTVLGRNPINQPEKLLQRIGYLTEEDSLPGWISVGEMIDFLRAIYPTWDDAYADTLCETFSLSRNQRLKSLSKGGRARVGLLAAIAHRPELLILDEPSSGLDPIARRDILEAVIRTVNEDGRTVLFSSHLLDEVDRVCDRIALLHQGRIEHQIEAEQLAGEQIELIISDDSDSEQPPLLDLQKPQALQLSWQRIGKEWSCIGDATYLSSELFSDSAKIVERRPLTLNRWFEANTSITSPTFEMEETS